LVPYPRFERSSQMYIGIGGLILLIIIVAILF
jgi:hypothetical protein